MCVSVCAHAHEGCCCWCVWGEDVGAVYVGVLLFVCVYVCVGVVVVCVCVEVLVVSVCGWC